MNSYLFDLEGDGFTPTKIHVVSYQKFKTSIVGGKFLIEPVGSITSIYGRQEMQKFFEEADVLVGHNIVQFDIPVVKKLITSNVSATLIDTLPLSWTLYSEHPRHGLEVWGERFGVEKPKIDDWENLSVKEYTHRCEEDVKINMRLWKKQYALLGRLYGDKKGIRKYCAYLTFKMDCAREQAEIKWKLNDDLATKTLLKLQNKLEERTSKLKRGMPKVPVVVKRVKPNKCFKKNGELSVTGQRWFDLLKQRGLPKDFNEEVEQIISWDEPNPGSHLQIKNWLYDLGWMPSTFKYVRDKDTGDTRKIPQVSKTDSPELCPSVERLIEKEPAIREIEGIGILRHRISILEGFLKNVDSNGYLQAKIAGLTNTLRFKHSVLVNLPGVDKPYGKEIRGCLIADEGYVLCGSDQASLEDRTKQHWMYVHDPEYVQEMQTDDFDPHLDIAQLAGVLSSQQVADHKAGKASYKAERSKYKVVNYSATYGISYVALARAMGCSEEEAAKLLEVFWGRNWAIIAVAEGCEVKTIGGKKWLFNPVSEFWYSLRYEKDRFSTLNQGTGVYCFDHWIRNVRKTGLKIMGQFHDEIITTCVDDPANKVKLENVLRDAMRKTNNQLKLNRELDIDVQFGKCYADIH